MATNPGTHFYLAQVASRDICRVEADNCVDCATVDQSRHGKIHLRIRNVWINLSQDVRFMAIQTELSSSLRGPQSLISKERGTFPDLGLRILLATGYSSKSSHCR